MVQAAGLRTLLRSFCVDTRPHSRRVDDHALKFGSVALETAKPSGWEAWLANRGVSPGVAATLPELWKVLG